VGFEPAAETVGASSAIQASTSASDRVNRATDDAMAMVLTLPSTPRAAIADDKLITPKATEQRTSSIW
jgi:hypothetical protein